MTTLAQVYQQNPAAVCGSLARSALVSVLPLAAGLVLLGAGAARGWCCSGLRLRVQGAAPSGLAAALLVAVLGLAMPAGMALSAAAHGALIVAVALKVGAARTVAAWWAHRHRAVLGLPHRGRGAPRDELARTDDRHRPRRGRCRHRARRPSSQRHFRPMRLAESAVRSIWTRCC